MKISTLKKERVNALIEITSKRFGVNVLAKSRRRPVIYARAACFMAMRTYLNLTYKQIGFFFDKSHASVLHSLFEWSYYIKNDPKIKETYSTVVEEWFGGSDSIYFLSEKDKIKHLESQIKSLTLQLSISNSKLKQLME